MALSLAKSRALKPDIKLVQALSEFEAILPDDQKAKLRKYRSSPPSSTDVIRFTAEIDRDAARNRKSRQYVGTRLTNVLHAVQEFSTVVESLLGSSQSQIAGTIWGVVKLSLQLASSISSYFDQLSTLFMRIGLTCPRFRDFGLLYPESSGLQRALCEYFVVLIRLCKQVVLFSTKPFWSQLSFSLLKPFESEFGDFQQDLENLACNIRDEITLASKVAQNNEAIEMSQFRVWDNEEARERKRRRKAELRFLDACSVYNHEKSWKQARKRGNCDWICHNSGYKQWKQEMVSSTLWCTGILGSGKTVLAANVVEDLKISTSAAVVYFFCRYDEAESLRTRTIIGSIARQIFDHMTSNIVNGITEVNPGTIDTDQIMGYLLELLPSRSQKYFIIIDGLDDCEEEETRLLFQCMERLLVSKNVFQVYCSGRPDAFRWAHALPQPQRNISMPQTSAVMKEYVEYALVDRLESGILSVSDSKIVFNIQDALLENAHGMFILVEFQIDSICSQKTDEAILTALGDLPNDLTHIYDGILRKLQHSDAADPRFCRKIFDLLAAALRPLTLEELREAVSVEPGKIHWDAGRQVIDMLKSLSASCGSLVAVDEEYLTVHFAHPSVKQHLLSEPTDSDIREYHINMEEADLYLSNIIDTYLHFGFFDQQLAKANSPMSLQVKKHWPAILDTSLPQSIIAYKSDVRPWSQLEPAARIVGISQEQTQPAHPFLSYVLEYWFFHTKVFKPARVEEYSLLRSDSSSPLSLLSSTSTIETPLGPVTPPLMSFSQPEPSQPTYHLNLQQNMITTPIALQSPLHEHDDVLVDSDPPNPYTTGKKNNSESDGETDALKGRNLKLLSLVNLMTYSYSQTFVSTWSNISKYFTKLLMAYGLLEDLVQTGKKRIHWTCHCGYSSFDDFVELRPGAVDAYEALLREHASTQQLSQSTTNRTGFFRNLRDPRTIFSFLGKQTANQTFLPQFQTAGIAPNNQTPALTASADDLFLLLCVPHKQYATRLVHLDLRAIVSDQDFFYSLKRNYRSMRGTARSLLSLRTLKRVKFVQFEMYKSELVDIRKVDDLPPVDRRDEYRYRPMPAEFIPPVGEHHMMHLCTHPEDADETQVICLDRIPKKLKERLLVCPSNGTGIGWGVHFVEGWHYTLAWLLVFVTLLVSSVVFLICWAVLRHDLQSASGVAAYMLAFVALSVGTVQAALELY